MLWIGYCGNLQIHSCAVSQSQTFVVLFLLAASQKVNDVFGVGYVLHKLLTEARGVEGVKAPAVVNLGRRGHC